MTEIMLNLGTGILFFFIIALVLTAPDLNESDQSQW